MNKMMCGYFVIASLCSMAMAQQSTVAPRGSVTDMTMLGAKIARTMTSLATSTLTQRNSVRVLFYGQSITAQTWSNAIIDRLKKEYPNADLTIENRAIGGFEADRLMKTAHQDLYPFYPDLVIFQDYGGLKGELEDMISNIRRLTTAEILIATHHVSHPGNAWVQAEYDKQSQLIRDLAAKYDCELADVRGEWKQYLADYHLQPQDLLKDSVHLNDKGCKLMEDLIGQHLRYDKTFANPHADWIKTIPVQFDSDNAIKVKFTGNRVDLVTEATNKPLGTARILIDGKPPSKNSKAYAITRTSLADRAWWPAIYTVGWQNLPLIENWTLKFAEVSEDAKQFKYHVTGSKTGPDGSGNSEERFISNSGRVVIDPRDFGIESAQKMSKKPCPPDFEIKWSVVPMFQDIYSSKENRPTVVQLIENGSHTLEIIPNGDGVVPLKAIRVFQPALP